MTYGMARKKPTQSECKTCMSMAESCGTLTPCNECPREENVEILQFVTSFWGTQAICKDINNQFIKVDTHNLKAIDICPMCGEITDIK